ncbi:hypothetical protein ALO79_200021 [Pseudomonas syringae pv. castaneae]|uniref:Uncharacterized protein n=1 Tax=Pseudomonas syringae pv. castaneae TaxID=264450 RepID=A0A0P9PIP3_PSESX|nr:hypothetical protein ALO79_200021 [Pseudomonas syringae pv. castaneae]
MVAVGTWHLEGVQQQRLVGLGEQRHIAYRHRRDGFAVITVAQGDEALLVGTAAIDPVMKAHLHRHFDAGRTVIGVEAPCQSFWRHFHQALGQLNHRLVAETGEDHMLQLVDLVLDSLVDAWVGMAEYVDPPGADGVEVALAFKIFQPDALTALDGDQRQLFVVFHLGAGMPQHCEVALHPLVVQAHLQSPRGGSRRARAKQSGKPMQ